MQCLRLLSKGLLWRAPSGIGFSSLHTGSMRFQHSCVLSLLPIIFALLVDLNGYLVTCQVESHKGTYVKPIAGPSISCDFLQSLTRASCKHSRKRGTHIQSVNKFRFLSKTLEVGLDPAMQGHGASSPVSMLTPLRHMLEVPSPVLSSAPATSTSITYDDPLVAGSLRRLLVET
eukprot:6311054-Amphidinium_carterae.1